MEWKLRTDELTLGDLMLVHRMQHGDMTAMPDLLRSRVENEGFDPLLLRLSEANDLLGRIAVLAQEHIDEVGNFVSSIKVGSE